MAIKVCGCRICLAMLINAFKGQPITVVAAA